MAVGGLGSSPGFWYRPSLVIDAAQELRNRPKEVFGPARHHTCRFSGEEQAFAWANDVEYGLAASVFAHGCRPGRCAPRASFSSARSGSASHLRIVSEMPHGGFKQSGHGKDMSIYSVDAHTEIKHIMINLDS